MLLKFLLFTVVFVYWHGIKADFTESSPRQGNFNKYFVYTRENHREGYELVQTEASVSNSTLLRSRDTVVIIHGHQGSAFNSLNPVVKDAFLTAANLNVIVVDWSVYASLSYTNAVGAVPSVGLHIANLISFLKDNGSVELNRLHIVGFNLGAHVAGFAGRALGCDVARITGLDPSSRQWGSNSRRLSKADARYVEVIHTDGDGLKSNGLGDAIGHTDFYPNGGGNQPGCLRSNICNHNRAWEFFAATVIHDHLVANNCASSRQLLTNSCRGYTLNMGNNQYVKFGSGIFRVNTKRSFPF